SAADVRARIFTPAAELPFAGHPLLGSAFIASEGQPGTVRIQTGAGVIPVSVERNGEELYGVLEQGIPGGEPFPAAAELLSALGVSESELPIEAYRNGPLHVYVALGSEQEVSRLEPDMTAL